MESTNVKLLAEKVAQVILTDASGMSRQFTYRGTEKDTKASFEAKLDRFVQKLEDKASDKAFNDAEKKKEKKDKDDKKKDKDKDSEINAFVKKLTTILAPAAVVASIIGSDTGGMKVFMSSIKVLGNVLGTAFAPVLFMGASAVLSLADMISDWLLPNLDTWYSWLVSTGFELFKWLEDEVTKSINSTVDRLNMLASIIGATIEAIKEWKDNLDPKKSKGAAVFDAMTGGPIRNILGGLFNTNKNAEPSKTEQLGNLIDGLTGRADSNSKGTASKFSDELWKKLGLKTDANGRPILNPPGGFTGRMQGNMKEVLKEFRMQNGATPQSMGIAQASRSAQLAALQMSPFEAKTLMLIEKVADAMEKVVSKLPLPATTE